MNKRLVTVSKFISKYLRHEPEALGLVLEPGGWVPVEGLLAGACRIGFSITAEELHKVVAENDKQRFAFDETGSKIRANQGHSAEVNLHSGKLSRLSGFIMARSPSSSVRSWQRAFRK